MSELHERVDMNKLYFEYKSPPKGVRFYVYFDSK